LLSLKRAKKRSKKGKKGKKEQKILLCFFLPFLPFLLPPRIQTPAGSAWPCEFPGNISIIEERKNLGDGDSAGEI